jgi:hypothetical protein
MFNYIRRQLRSPENKIFKDLPFVFEVNDKSGLDGVYQIEVKGIRTIGAFFRMSNENVNRAAIIIPPLDMSLADADNWIVQGQDITFARIDMEEDYVPFQKVINLKTAHYINLEYETKE